MLKMEHNTHFAPFTDVEVLSIQAYQTSGVFHPLTCGNQNCRQVLVAYQHGLVCLVCGYSQDWVMRWMVDGTWTVCH
jgi:hypothetical protein